MSLWYWLQRDLTSQQQSECISRGFRHGAGVDQKARRVGMNHGFDGE